MEKEWKISEKAPDDALKNLSEYPKIIAQLLYNRGIKDKKEAEQFFYPDYDKDLLDPYLIFGMKDAVSRIINAHKNKEKIVIYHDYDADGVCGSVVLSSAFSDLGIKFKTYTPDRQKEGYGLNIGAIEKILKDGVDLLITVDCGITNVNEINVLNKNGVDVIIIDHHIPLEVLPEAYAIVNPKQSVCEYPFKDMCAAGVVFKLCCALFKSDLAKKAEIREGMEKWLLDIVAVATIADMMPLLGENRTLVKFGLLVLKKTRNLGLKKLIANSDRFRFGIDSNFVAFQIAPKINATSRMTHASISYNLLNSKNEDEVDRLSEVVNQANNDRRKFVDRAVTDAIFWVEKEIEEKGGTVPNVIFLGNDEWTPGIVGLIASRLTEKYQRPSFIYGRVGNIFKGSCRGIDGYNIVEVMEECEKIDREIFKSFGGHKGAGGFAVYDKKIDIFKNALFEISEKKFKEISKKPKINIESEILPSEINWNTLSFLDKFEPFGQANPVPVFVGRKFEVYNIKIVGNGDKHLKLTLKSILDDGKVLFFDAIGFGLGGLYEKIKKGDKIDIVFEMDANEWQGRREIQLKIKDLRLTYNDIN